MKETTNQSRLSIDSLKYDETAPDVAQSFLRDIKKEKRGRKTTVRTAFVILIILFSITVISLMRRSNHLYGNDKAWPEELKRTSRDYYPTLFDFHPEFISGEVNKSKEAWKELSPSEPRIIITIKHQFFLTFKKKKMRSWARFRQTESWWIIGWFCRNE